MPLGCVNAIIPIVLCVGVYVWVGGWVGWVGVRKGSSQIPASKQGWKPCRRFDQMLWPSSKMCMV